MGVQMGRRWILWLRLQGSPTLMMDLVAATSSVLVSGGRGGLGGSQRRGNIVMRSVLAGRLATSLGSRFEAHRGR